MWKIYVRIKDQKIFRDSNNLQIRCYCYSTEHLSVTQDE